MHLLATQGPQGVHKDTIRRSSHKFGNLSQ